MLREGSAAEVVERLVLYVEAALQLARDAREPELAQRLAAIHARLLRDGLHSSHDHSLF